MPPIRTISTNKPQRTERTHEENQERAYIAASRRSDRSLEARIESARRASEIHKKRTGRALRVTEQDVVNEEMYEEEDEDLPAQIRRLQHFAHLQTNSDNFNYRLHNYMASHIGTRQALMNQAQFANAPFFSNQFAPPQPTTMLPPQMFHYNQAAQQQQHHGTDATSTPGFAGPGMHGRSASFSMNLQQSTPGSPMTPQGFDHRRMSMPTQTLQSPSASQSHTPSTPSAAQPTALVKQEHDSKAQSQMLQGPARLPTARLSGLDFTGNANLAPFSTSLPTETQQLLVGPTSMHDGAFNPYFFSSSSMPLSYPPYKPSLSAAAMPTSASSLTSSASMNPGLSQLDTSNGSIGNNNIGSPSSAGGYVASATSDFGYFSGSNDALFGGTAGDSGVKFEPLSATNSHGGSANVTPGGTDWQNFIDTSFEDVVGESGTGSTGH